MSPKFTRGLIIVCFILVAYLARQTDHGPIIPLATVIIFLASGEIFMAKPRVQLEREQTSLNENPEWVTIYRINIDEVVVVWLMTTAAVFKTILDPLLPFFVVTGAIIFSNRQKKDAKPPDPLK